MAILSKACKPDNFELHNSLKLSFTNILRLHSSSSSLFDSISSNIGELLSINPSANVLVFGDLNVHHKDWLTHSGGTDRSGEL